MQAPEVPSADQTMLEQPFRMLVLLVRELVSSRPTEVPVLHVGLEGWTGYREGLGTASHQTSDWRSRLALDGSNTQ